MGDGRDAHHPGAQGRIRAPRSGRDPAYSIGVFDERDNVVEILCRVADLSVAQAAFEAAVANYPDMRIFLRQVCRVIRSSDRED